MESCWIEVSLKQSLFSLLYHLFLAPLAPLSNSVFHWLFFFFCIWTVVFVLDSTLNPISITWRAPLRMGLYPLCVMFLHVAGRCWNRSWVTRCWLGINNYERKREKAGWGGERIEIQTLTKSGGTLQEGLQPLEPISIGQKWLGLYNHTPITGHKFPRKSGHQVPSWWMSQWSISMSDVFLDEPVSCQFCVDSRQGKGKITMPGSLRKKQVGPHKGLW